jgi:kinetochore-associated protein DSN1
VAFLFYNINLFSLASSLSEELKHFTDRLGNDGTLQKCFVEDSKE